ncbi:hypothetical protein [Micromonospora sp. NPDC126480]|uniref:hypothetical protein n=1 Tax=Micromonospora sp. NPDC126480 TaxID=3155312 RepID=UPI0033201C9C
MLNAFLQALVTKMIEAVVTPLVSWLAPRALRSVPHRATPDCPRCGGYGVARWAPRRARVAFQLSILAFVSGFTLALLGVLFALVAMIVAGTVGGWSDVAEALALLAASLVPGAVMVVGAVGLAHYHSHPPRWCARCGARWPERSRDEYLAATGAVRRDVPSGTRPPGASARGRTTPR